MNEVFDKLCEVFEEELERQENILRLAKAQEEALLRRDTALLNVRTEALNLVLNETAQAEAERLRAARRAVDALSLTQSEQSLSGVVGAIDEPWRSRLAEIQLRLQAVLSESATVVRRNNRMLRRLLVKTNDTLSIVSGAVFTGGAGYTTAGYREHNSAGACLLNQAG